jgi:hypothetical protein
MMKRQLSRVSPLQTAKVVAILYFVISLPLCALAFVSTLVLPSVSFATPMMLIGLPILYAAFGFIFTLLAAWLYNFVAMYTGGIEYTSVEVPGV